MKAFSANPRRLLACGGLAFVLFQASSGFGFFLPLAWALCAAIVYALVFAWSVATGFKWIETWSTDHPVKGQVLGRTLKLANESWFNWEQVTVLIREEQPGLGKKLLELPLAIQRKGSQILPGEVFCHYRGVYVLGMSGIRASDPLGLLTTTWHYDSRTFYVYPRNISLDHGLISRGTPRLRRIPAGTDQDEPGTVAGLLRWRPGMTLDHIDQGKFAATGEIWLRQAERKYNQGLTLLLDLSRGLALSRDLLSAEDILVETAYALAARQVRQGEYFRILAHGVGPLILEGSGPGHWEQAWRRSLELVFAETRPGIKALLSYFTAKAVLPPEGFRVLSSNPCPELLAPFMAGTLPPWSLLLFTLSWPQPDKDLGVRLSRTWPDRVFIIESLGDLYRICQ